LEKLFLKSFKKKKNTLKKVLEKLNSTLEILLTIVKLIGVPFPKNSCEIILTSKLEKSYFLKLAEGAPI
jgi:hypothetical protein